MPFTLFTLLTLFTQLTLLTLFTLFTLITLFTLFTLFTLKTRLSVAHTEEEKFWGAVFRPKSLRKSTFSGAQN